MSSVILTADDYGACDFIDNGIIRALNDHKINTVTAFVTHPDSESRMRTLLELREELKQKNKGKYTFNIGLHFSLTSGTAITKQSSLTNDEGTFEFHEAKNYPFRKIKHDDLRKELNAQLNLLEQWLGNSPIDHVTNHHGICYLDLGFFENYVDVISLFKPEKYRKLLPIRSPMSWLKSDMKTWKNGKVLLPTIKQGLNLGFWKKVGDVTNRKLKVREEHAFRLEINYPDFLADTIYGLPFGENISFLTQQLAPKNYSAEFMFHLGHPGRTVSDLQQTIDDLIMPHGIDRGYFLNRTKELDVLTGTDLDELFNKNEIQRIFYSEA